jgi:hypothetical protein
MSGTWNRDQVISDMLGMLSEAAEKRLNGEISRGQHAMVVAYVDNFLRKHDLTWDDLNGRTVTA